MPAHETISKAGDWLENAGMIIAGLCLVVGIIAMFNGSGAGPLLGIPFGLLLMITGYTKKTSAATMAMFILQSRELDSAAKDEASAEH